MIAATTQHLLLVPVVLPLCGAMLLFLWRSHWRLTGMPAGAITTLASFALLWLTLTEGTLDYALGGWVRPLGIHWRLDVGGALMLVATSLLMLAVFGYERPRPDGQHGLYFAPLSLLLWSGLATLFMAGDLFHIYVALELVTLAAVALVALGRASLALDAATRYLFAALFSSLLYLLGVALLYGAHGVLDLGLLARELAGEPALTDMLAATAISLGLLLKAAVVPLHFWLPAAHSRAEPGVSALLSGIVAAAALYLFLRLWLGPFGSWLVAPLPALTGTLGAVGLLWGAHHAMLQPRLKRIIAYSTISQSGLLLLALPLAAEDDRAAAAIFILMFNHALAKAALFLSAGVLVHAGGHDRLQQLPHVRRGVRLAWLAFGLAALALIGAPPSFGFSGKWLLLQVALEHDAWAWLALVLLSSVLTLGYLYRVLAPALRTGLAPDTPQKQEEGHALQAMPGLLLALLALAGGWLVWGLSGLIAPTGGGLPT